MVVEDVMSPLPYVARVTDSVGRVMHMLTEADVRHMLVVEGDALVGIISDRDVREIAPFALTAENPEQARKLLEVPVSKVMNTDVITLEPEAELSDAIDLMIEHRIGAIPVTEPGGRKLLGIVSYVDILRAAREYL